MFRNDLSAEDGVTITPNDTTALNLRGIYVAGAGNVVITTASGDQTVAVAAGAEIRVPITKVKSTGTTATGIFGYLK